MKKKILIAIIALGLLFTTVSFKGDFFEIAKQIEIFTTSYPILIITRGCFWKPKTYRMSPEPKVRKGHIFMYKHDWQNPK